MKQTITTMTMVLLVSLVSQAVSHLRMQARSVVGAFWMPILQMHLQK